MASLLLVLIYVAFISLGLPDSLLGSAWPVMHGEFAVPLSYAGIVSMIISAGTIVSSLMSDRLTRRLGVGLITTISVLTTALALFGFSRSSHFAMVCLWAIPYGLGAGAVDAALNNYVALHYTSRHMSWLHCFWGVGASISPYIMGYALGHQLGWATGYSYVSVIQFALSAILFISLPLWTNHGQKNGHNRVMSRELGVWEASRIKGVRYVLLVFLACCGLEATTGLWTSTYLVEVWGVHRETAASFGSLFFLGITLGRFISGFIADRVGDQGMIRYGIGIVLVGITLVLLPLETNIFALAGLLIIGLGNAPIYPAIIHSTPSNFGQENSQSIIGIQMASAYLGSTLVPPLFGFLSRYLSLRIFPAYLLIFGLMMLVASEKLNRTLGASSDPS